MGLCCSFMSSPTFPNMYGSGEIIQLMIGVYEDAVRVKEVF